MNSSSYPKTTSALGQSSKQQYASVGQHAGGHYVPSHGPPLGPSGHHDGRIPKKGSTQPKHKVHGMNQSMDAGIGADRYQQSSHILSAGFTGLKGARGDRQSMLAEQHHQVQHLQHR